MAITRILTNVFPTPKDEKCISNSVNEKIYVSLIRESAQGNAADTNDSLSLLKGGSDSGFRKVEVETYTPRLLHFSGTSDSVVVKEVILEDMNSEGL